MRFTLFAAMFLAVVSTAFAGSNRWTSSGPGVGVITGIQEDPSDSSIAYAMTLDGIYRTTNAGQSWSALRDALLKDGPSELVVAADSTLYASVGDMVVASTDRGDHWSRRGTTGGAQIVPSHTPVTALAYNATSGSLYAGSDTGISASADGGKTWTASQLPPIGPVLSMAVTSNAAYAVVLVSAVVLDLRSTDDGRTWQVVKGPGQPVLFGHSGSASLYAYTSAATVLISNDLGDSWKKSAIPKVAAIETLAVSNAGLYAATTGGVFVYDSRRGSWSLAGDRVIVNRLAISSSLPARLYGFSDSGVVTLKDAAQHWVPAATGLPGANASNVVIARVDPSIRYTIGQAGLFRTDDSGESWRPVNGIQRTIPPEISISPDSADTAFTWGNNFVAKTSDGGTTWKAVSTKLATQLAIAPSRPGTVYAAFADGMAKSVDGGNTWPPTAQIPLDSFDYSYYYYSAFNADAIAVDPSNDSSAFVTKHGGVYRTTDGGTSWKLVSAESDLRALQIDPVDSTTLYAINGSDVVRSSDQGSTWSPAGLIDKSVVSLAMSGSRLYAATSDGHFYFIEHGDQTWTGMDPLASGVSRVDADASGTHLAAATAGGVWQYDIAGQDTAARRLSDDALRLPHALESLLAAPASNAGVVIPVVGTVAGAGGMSFTTELTLVNRGESLQHAVLMWLPEGGGAAHAFAVDLPPGSITIWNAGDRFEIAGIGSLAVFATDGDGNVDANASIDAAAEIWTHPVDGRAPLSQSILAARPALFSRHVEAEATGLTHDAKFRTNVGIVNLSGTAHEFTVVVDGASSQGQSTIYVPAFAIVQTALPESDYGALSLRVIADEPAAWLFYGSSVDRVTGEAHTSVGTPIEP